MGAAFFRGRRLLTFLLSSAAFIRGRSLIEYTRNSSVYIWLHVKDDYKPFGNAGCEEEFLSHVFTISKPDFSMSLCWSDSVSVFVTFDRSSWHHNYFYSAWKWKLN